MQEIANWLTGFPFLPEDPTTRKIVCYAAIFGLWGIFIRGNKDEDPSDGEKQG